MCQYLINRMMLAGEFYYWRGRRLYREIGRGVFFCGICILVAACTRSEKPVAPASEAWSWERYPLETLLPVARVDGQVKAELSNRFYAPANGRLQLMTAGSEPLLEKDMLWAIFAPDVLKLGEEMLSARRASLKARREMLDQVDIPQKRLEAEKRLREAQHLKDMALRLGNDAVAWKALSELVPEAGLEEADRSPASLDRTITIVTQELAFLNRNNGSDASADLQVAEVELRQAEIEQVLKRSQYEMRMPFRGKLICNIEVRSGQTDYPVISGQLIGLARREDTLTCEVRMQDSRWLGLPTDALCLKVRLADGKELNLPFAARRIREQMGNEELYYVFTVPAAEVAILRSNIDSVLQGELCLTLKQSARIVPKIALLTVYPSEFGSADWVGGVHTLWPEARLVAVGGTVVAINPVATEVK